VGREVVQHDVDLFGRGSSRDDFRHESQEVIAGMPPGGLAMDLPGFDIKRGVKRKCPVTVVFDLDRRIDASDDAECFGFSAGVARMCR